MKFSIINLKVFVCLLLLTVMVSSVLPQGRQVRMYGSVYDKDSHESLIGVFIINVETKTGTTTDSYGRYSVWLPADCDSSVIEISFIGYSTKKIKVSCDTGLNFENVIYLEKTTYDLEEVVVSAIFENTALTKQMSLFRVNPVELKGLPSFSGERDLLNYLQLTPGIQIAGDLNSNLYVRGGDYDQNLFLLDNMPLYHVSHLGGVLSTFNSEIIKSADIQKGTFPARYGGRLSSVVDVHTKDGDMYKHHANLTLGLISSKIHLNGPIQKEKSSYLVSFRKNTIPFLNWMFALDQRYSFYDMNVKLNSQISPTDRVYFSFYNGSDNINMKIQEQEVINSTMKVGWGNLAGSLRYSKIFTPKLFADFILGSSGYYYSEKSNVDYFEGVDNFFSNDFSSRLNDIFFKLNTKYYTGNNLNLRFGYEFSNLFNSPGISNLEQTGAEFGKIAKAREYQSVNSFDNNLFLELDHKNLNGFAINTGIRGNMLFVTDTAFYDLQPRISLSKSIAEFFSLKVAYTSVNQPFHSISSNGGGIPVEYRIPATKLAPPSKSSQIVAGSIYTNESGEYEIVIEGFYRNLWNLVTIKDGVYFTNDFRGWEQVIHTNGNGEAKGIELTARKIKGNTTGWLSATIAKSTRQFDEINNGETYPFRYDRRFEYKAFFQNKITEKLNFSITWVYGTGNAYTLPKSQIIDHEDNLIFIYGSKNSFREAPYHRLDLAIQYSFMIKKINSSLDISVLNVYNRKNPYYYFTKMEHNRPVLYQHSQFPIIPSFSLSFFL